MGCCGFELGGWALWCVVVVVVVVVVVDVAAWAMVCRDTRYDGSVMVSQ